MENKDKQQTDAMFDNILETILGNEQTVSVEERKRTATLKRASDEKRRQSEQSLPVESGEAIDLSVETARGLPWLLRDKPGGRGFRFFLAVFSLCFSLLILVFYLGSPRLIRMYDEAAPSRVAAAYVDFLSESRLFNDIALHVKGSVTEFESEAGAAAGAMDFLSLNGEKRFFEVSRNEGGIRYDIYSGNTHVYTLSLVKTGEISPIGIDLWEVGDAAFSEESLKRAAGKYTFSAPKDANVYVNGRPVGEEYITNDNYRFFIGSIWESTLPEGARCVQYTIDGLYCEPEFKAYINGDELSTYKDEGENDFHAKYPEEWVKDYKIEVPSGALLTVNGILATKISEHGEAPDTIFDKGSNGKTDIYLIEGLFEEPILGASFNDEPLGMPIADGTYYRFPFTDDMYIFLSITAPKGATVTVNGVTLGEDNAHISEVPFSVWSGYPLALTSCKPTELKNTTSAALPELVEYRISHLYSTPEIKVSFGGLECEAVLSEGSEPSRRLSYVYDFPKGSYDKKVESFATAFAKTYMKYITEGCYGIKDDIEIRKNFYNNWKDYLEYITPDSDCFLNALDSYTDVEYRPSHKLETEQYTVSGIRAYSDDIYILRITAVTKDNEDPAPISSTIDAVVIRINGKLLIWMHNEIAA